MLTLCTHYVLGFFFMLFRLGKNNVHDIFKGGTRQNMTAPAKRKIKIIQASDFYDPLYLANYQSTSCLNPNRVQFGAC